ncbi:Protein-disulfide isomerase [Solibacillus isronensis B3W22]|uniref:Protein-disulfide isomerase n=1 Tax=Solibacillus isronensis B3W22 TaxID=1224748 RepID=K1KWT3_9BACL|nr:thioredoxin domain-containing protein [Solibacillus isronensis]AMO87592.1 protein-disulfide isomerase [Solibacillus silvestris]EKB44317.1 Protein-disulfide isomerase [Solibacillus isronensis B3W22]
MTEIKNDYLVIGDLNAPVKIEVFLNYACPYCATFYDLVDNTLPKYFTEKKVALVVKHYDKPREMLLPGTLINANLDYSNSERTLEIISELFKNQATWDKYSSFEIKKYIEEKYNLKEEFSNIDRSLLITAEAIERNVKMVPTVFINELEFQYPREIFAKELVEIIDKELEKAEV